MKDTRKELGSVGFTGTPIVYQRDSGDFYKVSPMGTGRRLGVFHQEQQMPTHRSSLPPNWMVA